MTAPASGVMPGYSDDVSSHSRVHASPVEMASPAASALPASSLPASDEPSAAPASATGAASASASAAPASVFPGSTVVPSEPPASLTGEPPLGELLLQPWNKLKPTAPTSQCDVFMIYIPKG